MTKEQNRQLKSALYKKLWNLNSKQMEYNPDEYMILKIRRYSVLKQLDDIRKTPILKSFNLQNEKTIIKYWKI